MRKILNIMRTAVAVLAVTAVAQACMQHGSRGLLDGLYDDYAAQEGLQVALLRDKGVFNGPEATDSVYVDMLMLTATDSAAWCRLQEDFRAPQPVEAMQRRIDAGEDIVTVGRYRGAAAVEANDMKVVSYLNRTVSIIHAASAADMQAVLHRNMENNINR